MGELENEQTAVAAEMEVKALRRKVRLLERDNRMLVVMNQNAEQLRRSYEAEKKLQYLYNDLLLENCPNMIFLFNEQLRFVTCSQACQKLLYTESRQELLNQPFEKIFSELVEPVWIEKLYQQNQAVLRQPELCCYDDTLNFLDGRGIHVQITVSPIIDDAKRCRGTVLSINDVTALVLARQREEEASASKSSFLANMSHEIRTPMNAIKGLSELLTLTELNSLQRNYVTNVIGAADSLLHIINDVLDFSKIDANKIDFVQVEYRLSNLLQEVCNVIHVKAEEKNLTLYIDADPMLPAKLWGDDVRVKQILTNLLSNAVKYTQTGSIWLRCYMRSAMDKDWLYFEVCDSGIGITDEEIKKIFDAFSRVDPRANRYVSGTGLGLAISKQLTQAMGGDIWAESSYGKGSTFTFRIPQQIADAVPLAAVSERHLIKVLLLGEGTLIEELKRQLNILQVSFQAVKAVSELSQNITDITHCISVDQQELMLLKQQSCCEDGIRHAIMLDREGAKAMVESSNVILDRPLLISSLAEFLNNEEDTGKTADAFGPKTRLHIRDVRALVVDDNEINRLVCREMLNELSVLADCAEGGAGAVELCREKKYDIIFMDHMMPEMDGVEATRFLRDGDGLNKNTPIIALTANVVNDMKSHYLANGMNDLIGKPMELSDLERALVRWLPHEKYLP